MFLRLFYISALLTLCLSKNQQKLRQGLTRFFEESELMGLTVEVAQNSSTIFKFNMGYRDFERKLPINNETIFRMASLSKSPTSIGLLQQFQSSKLNFTSPISDLLGFPVTNPHFPDTPITLEMVLTHQASFQQCPAYYSFLHDTYTGPPFPLMSQLLTPTGKYYDLCLFNTVPPGTFYEYVNYDYAIAATILERLSGERFDLYMGKEVFKRVGMGRTSYRREEMEEAVNDIAVLYRANEEKQWVPQADNWKGVMPERDFSSYVVGSNGAVFSPMGGLYSTTKDLTQYINILRTQGLASNGYRLLTPQSISNMLRPRYRYHSTNKALNSSQHSYNAYGFGIQTSTYDPYDRIFPHKVVRGHWGDSYGLISQYEFTQTFSFVYVINGARNGYHETKDSFYELQRQRLHGLLYSYLYE